MKLERQSSGYKIIAGKHLAHNKALPHKNNSTDVRGLKYTEIPKIAFGSQLLQIKQATPELNPLDAAKIWPIEGVEHAKEWPIPVQSLKILKERFAAAQYYNGIDTKMTPGLAVYNIDSSGRHYTGFYDALTNKLTITEGVVLFDIDKKGNVVDEALAHESYHCKRTHYFSSLSDEAITNAIDDRIFNALTGKKLPIYELIAGEKFTPVKEETAKLLVELSKEPDKDPTEQDLARLEDFMPDYANDSKLFFINVIKKLRWTYEKSIAIGFEPAIKANLFSLEDLEQRIPEKTLEKIMISQGLSKEGALRKIVNEKPGKLILMGYISQMDADNARKIRREILSNPNKPDEATMLKDLQNIFDMIDASYNLGLASNDKAKNINQYKVIEEYMYCAEEINARQTGLSHRIKVLKDLIEQAPDRSYQYKSSLETPQADYNLNETMKELINVRKEGPENQELIEKLTKQATELSRKADYTVPKMLNKKYETYIPFSYGENYRLPETTII